MEALELMQLVQLLDLRFVFAVLVTVEGMKKLWPRLFLYLKKQAITLVVVCIYTLVWVAFIEWDQAKLLLSFLTTVFMYDYLVKPFKKKEQK